MRFRFLSAVMLIPAALVACTQVPMAPTVAVMPGPNKATDAFMYDQATCKQFAESQVAGSVQQSNNQQVATAVIGTALGAGLGAAIGGGRGAAIGAASGALGGTGIAAGQSANAQWTVQQQYDIAYSQCMYTRGNQVPGYVPGYPPGYYPVR